MSFPLDESMHGDSPKWVYQLKEEYKIQGYKHQHTLEKLNFTEEKLPYRTKALLESCAKCCQILGLNELNPTNMLLKQTELLLAKKECDDKISRCEEYKLDIMLSRLKKQNEALDKASKKSVEEVAVVIENVASKQQLYLDKLQEYEEKIMNIEKDLPSGETALNFDAVLENNARIKSLDEEIKKLNSKLANPKKLPPDMTLAKEKLKQAKDELERLRSELNSKLKVTNILSQSLV